MLPRSHAAALGCVAALALAPGAAATSCGVVSSATGGGVDWNPAVTAAEGILTNPGDREYTLQNLPDYMAGGVYVGSRAWPGSGLASWSWEISYTAPARLFVWTENDANEAGVPDYLVGQGWVLWPAAGLTRTDPTGGQEETLKVLTKYFDTSGSLVVPATSTLVGGVISGSTCTADFGVTTTAETATTASTTTLTTSTSTISTTTVTTSTSTTTTFTGTSSTTTTTTTFHVTTVYRGTVYLNLTAPCTVVSLYTADPPALDPVFQRGIAAAVPTLEEDMVTIVAVRCARRLQSQSSFAAYTGVLQVDYDVRVVAADYAALQAADFVAPAHNGDSTLFAQTLGAELANSTELRDAGVDATVFQVWSDVPQVEVTLSDPARSTVVTTTAEELASDEGEQEVPWHEEAVSDLKQASAGWLLIALVSAAALCVVLVCMGCVLKRCCTEKPPEKPVRRAVERGDRMCV